MVRVRPLVTFLSVVGVVIGAPNAEARRAPVRLSSEALEPPHDLVPEPTLPRYRPPEELRTALRNADLRPATVEQLGEVVIMEGDQDILTDDGSGAVGIHIDAMRQDPVQIANRFYSVYPDEFDELIVLTSFTDNGSPGALAYEFPVQNDVAGIGGAPGWPARFDHSGDWGSTTGRLHAFVNMKGVTDYPKYDGLPIDDPHSFFYPVLGQEFAHRWLSFVRYRDHGGAISDRLLGRDRSHWSPLVDADASVIDGNHWVEDKDGTFNCTERSTRYSPLDLYLMGLVTPREVPPFFLINDAVTDGGHVIDPVNDWYYCEHVRGRREDVAVSQVIAAMGPRMPAAADSAKSFRVAFILVTRPGERAGDVLPLVEKVERARRIWEDKFELYTGGHGRVCTQVSADCGAAVARVISGEVAEGGGNKNGVIEPGEPVRVRFHLLNDGPVAAANVPVTVESPSLSFAQPTVTLASLGAGQAADVTFEGRFTTDGSACNRVLSVHATARVGSALFKGFAETVPGAADAYREHFDSDGGRWGVDLSDGSDRDTAHTNTWAWGTPIEYSWYGVFSFQPDGGVGRTGRAWFTGPEHGNVYSGATTGVEKGRASLWSPPIDLTRGLTRGAATAEVRPRVHYAVWFNSIDRSDPSKLQVSDQSRLILEAQNVFVDVKNPRFGKWWKLDQIDGADDRWRPREVDPASPDNGEAGLDVTRPVRFRFTVTNAGGADLVEAGIDDFAVVIDAPACHPDLATAAMPPVTAALPTRAGCALSHRSTGMDPLSILLSLLPLAALSLRRRYRCRSEF